MNLLKEQSDLIKSLQKTIEVLNVRLEKSESVVITMMLLKLFLKMSGKVSKKMSGKMSGKMSKKMSGKMSEKVSP